MEVWGFPPGDQISGLRGKGRRVKAAWTGVCEACALLSRPHTFGNLRHLLQRSQQDPRAHQLPFAQVALRNTQMVGWLGAASTRNKLALRQLNRSPVQAKKSGARRDGQRRTSRCTRFAIRGPRPGNCVTLPVTQCELDSSVHTQLIFRLTSFPHCVNIPPA